MKRTKNKLREYWDKEIAVLLPPHNDFSKAQNELEEHLGFVIWTFKRLMLPLIIFYVAAGLLLETNIFDSLFISLMVFVYSNFLPDTDFLIKKTNDKRKESLWYDKLLLLFFAPVIIYYVIAGRARPFCSTQDRCFHNFKTVAIYGAFLLVVGAIFWQETLKRIMLPVFGMAGFTLHILVDRGIHHWIEKRRKK